MRTITCKPWNLRRGDILPDGRIVARVSIIPGSGIVIMQNGPAIRFDANSKPITVKRGK